MTDEIAKALDLTPLVPDKKEIRSIKGANEYETAKGNMEQILDVGQQAVGELYELAKLSQDPRVYRVFTELISAMTTANKELMEIKKVDTEVKEIERVKDQPQTINQNLFVGSTAELSKFIEGIKKNENI
mgnify:FL=1